MIGNPLTLRGDPTWAAWLAWAHSKGAVLGQAQLQALLAAADAPTMLPVAAAPPPPQDAKRSVRATTLLEL